MTGFPLAFIAPFTFIDYYEVANPTSPKHSYSCCIGMTRMPSRW